MQIGCVVSEDRHLTWAKECEFDYAELKGDYLLQLSRTENLEKLRQLEHIPLYSMTSPLPREFGARIVGNDADHEFALEIFTQMVDLSASLGIRIIVLGSGQARNIPENFERDRAYGQFIDFLDLAMRVCTARNQILTIEPLHSGETNLINSCAQAQKIIEDIPEVSITADCYHIFTEHLNINDELHKSNVKHAHTSYLPRGSDIFNKEYQSLFLKKLPLRGCNNISIEEKFTSINHMNEILLKLRNLDNS